MAPSPESDLVERLLQGELRALSRLITHTEEGRGDVLATMERLWSHRAGARVLGVTGPPGAGKSTVVDKVIARHRAAGRRVAVLAVDPSSPFTGGAILGDRIRMQGHAADPGVFIRSLGTRGHHGGLTRTTREAAILCAAAGFDRIIVETVGVGQTELEVVGVADQVLVLLVPEAGDVIQTMKAGLLEGADVFAVNKCDRPGADKLAASLQAMLEDRAEIASELLPAVPIFRVSAQHGEGLDGLLEELDRRDVEAVPPGRALPPIAVAARLLGEEVARTAELEARNELSPDGDHADLGRALEAGTANPYGAVRALLGADR
ncbi:MAG: methylmalonyl Co-A mutase-associated GTPase MeaB [Proteobacteria bacterium]|nr:methylmalonyl Co-A mutase-associated GTPase MeaB [Pseudomonadota bacterium]